MRFHSYDSLRLFDVVARTASFTIAAAELNLTKGAISYRIKQLERDLGFAIFTRGHRSIALTEKGRQLLEVSRTSFRELDHGIAALRESDESAITVATSTYFASRWLSSRLMNFITAHPKISLRLLPLVDLIDLRRDQIDIVIRWGKGDWNDMESELLFACPAFPTAGRQFAKPFKDADLGPAMETIPLLQDRDGSTAWADWYDAASLPYVRKRDHLVIPDPNVRVEAVINNQGLALNDALVAPELAEKRLMQISSVTLDDYGYHLAYSEGSLDEPSFVAFRDWIRGEADVWKEVDRST